MCLYVSVCVCMCSVWHDIEIILYSLKRDVAKMCMCVVCAFLLYTMLMASQKKKKKPIPPTMSRNGNRKLLTVQNCEKKDSNVCIKIMFIFWRLDSIALFLHSVSHSAVFSVSNKSFFDSTISIRFCCAQQVTKWSFSFSPVWIRIWWCFCLCLFYYQQISFIVSTKTRVK